jgi:molybdopterin converting factor small subunit
MPQVVTAKDGSIKLPQELLRRWRIPQGTEWWLDRREAALVLLPRLPDLRKLYVEPTTVCNLNCRTCIRNTWQDPKAHMEMETFRHKVNKMKIYVRLFASLAKNVSKAVLAHHPQGFRAGTPLEIELPENSTLDDLISYLDLPREEIKLLFVNGRGREPNYRLKPEDEVGIFPPVGGGQMETITLDVWLYGPLARYGGDPHNRIHANPRPTLPAGSCMRDLLEHLGMPSEERGITFINGDLSAMPGLQPDLDQILQDGDRVAFFHLKSMWPSQYRHGAALAPGLARVMEEENKLFHHRARDQQT